jgi:predicted acyl esterase
MVSCYLIILATSIDTNVCRDTRSFVYIRKQSPFLKHGFSMFPAFKTFNFIYHRRMDLFGESFAPTRTRDGAKNRRLTIYHQVSSPLDSLFQKPRWDHLISWSSAFSVPYMHYIGWSADRNRGSIRNFDNKGKRRVQVLQCVAPAKHPRSSKLAGRHISSNMSPWDVEWLRSWSKYLCCS